MTSHTSQWSLPVSARLDLRLGIDVGGTHTDAVVVDPSERVLAKTKEPTTADVTSGISAAIGALLARSQELAPRISHAMLGTTHATNAILQGAGLRPVAVLRIGGPATHSVPPLVTWPSRLRSVVAPGIAIVDGGIEIDGSELSPLDEGAVGAFFSSLVGRVEAVAITGVFCSVSNRQELRAGEIARECLGDVPISLSHEIGSVGLIERENATVLNAALIGIAHGMAGAFTHALAAHGLSPMTYFAQNDGTLMALDFALRYPVLTVGCGPANSLRGAARLSGIADALVADVGGTSTEIGALVGGFPSQTGEVIGVGGVRTNFRMPAVVALPIGGGTIVTHDRGRTRLGPGSVGHRITEQALVFGGSIPTLTDAAVQHGRVELGHCAPPSRLGSTLGAALAQSDAAIADGVDRIKPAAHRPPLVVVGGAGFLVESSVPGISEVLRTEHAEVANAIGAAIAQVSGQVECVSDFRKAGRTAAIDGACAAARAQAVLAGADPERTEIVEVEEVPLAYLTDPAVRIRARAVGPLCVEKATNGG
jgi:N-methylhydantoinase A/oxoprolinase/acetone carboxylase beta subunit